MNESYRESVEDMRIDMRTGRVGKIEGNDGNRRVGTCHADGHETRMMPGYRLRIGDILLTAAFLLLAAGIWSAFGGQASSSVTARVTQYGRLLAEIRLTGLEEPVRVTFSGDVHGVVIAEGGTIRFEASACPDQICVQTGSISREGQIAACLPAGVLIRIVGDASAGSAAGHAPDTEGADVILH